jgi:hypothetical protein
MQLGSISSYRRHRLAWEVEEAEEVVVEAYRRLCVCCRVLLKCVLAQSRVIWYGVFDRSSDCKVGRVGVVEKFKCVCESVV